MSPSISSKTKPVYIMPVDVAPTAATVPTTAAPAPKAPTTGAAAIPEIVIVIYGSEDPKIVAR